MVNQDNVVRMSHQPGPRRRNGQPQHPTSSNSPSSRPRRHVAQNCCTERCGVCHGLHCAACNLGPRDPHHRPVEQKKEGLESIVSPGCQAHKQHVGQILNSNLDLIPTHAKPNDAVPLQRSRTSLPNPSGPMAHFIPAFVIDSMRASFHHARNNNTPRGNVALRLRPNQGSASFSRSNTSCRDGPTSDQRARNLLPSHSISRAPSPDPPAVITMIRMTLKTPSSRLQGRAQQAGSPPRRSAKIQFDSLPPPRRSHLIECGIGPG